MKKQNVRTDELMSNVKSQKSEKPKSKKGCNKRQAQESQRKNLKRNTKLKTNKKITANKSGTQGTHKDRGVGTGAQDMQG